MRLVDKTCASTVYITPLRVLAAVREYFNGPIALDPATEPNNPTDALAYWTKEDDGLSRDWFAHDHAFVNPPYGPDLLRWVSKIVEQARSGMPILALLPGQRFETAVWQEELLPSPNLSGIVFIRGRLKFLRPDGSVAGSNPYGSMLYVFNASTDSRLHALVRLGVYLPVSN